MGGLRPGSLRVGHVESCCQHDVATRGFAVSHRRGRAQADFFQTLGPFLDLALPKVAPLTA